MKNLRPQDRWTKKQKHDAIREAFRTLGKDASTRDIIDSVRVNNVRASGPGMVVTWQMVCEVKSHRIAPQEWRKWDEDRNRASSSMRNTNMKITREEIGDEIVETYTPTEDADPPHPLNVPKPATTELVKHDHEIVAILNLCVDWTKFHRFMTLTDMDRMDHIAREFGLAFDSQSIRFGLAGNGGGFTRCGLES